MVATVLLMMVTIGAAGTLYTVVENTQSQAQRSTGTVEIFSDSVDIESCYLENEKAHIVVRNTGQEAVNVSKSSIILDGYIVEDDEYSYSQEIVGPQQSFRIDFEFLFGSGTEVMFTGNDIPLSSSCTNLPNIETIFEWDRSDGDTVSTLKNQMNEEIYTGLMEENKPDFVRWAEKSNDGRFIFSRNLENNNGSARIKLKFKGESFEGSGAAFWIMDSAGTNHTIDCNPGISQITCSKPDSDNFLWEKVYRVSSDNKLEKLYFSIDMENVHGNWWDTAKLYNLRVQVNK